MDKKYYSHAPVNLKHAQAQPPDNIIGELHISYQSKQNTFPQNLQNKMSRLSDNGNCSLEATTDRDQVYKQNLKMLPKFTMVTCMVNYQYNK